MSEKMNKNKFSTKKLSLLMTIVNHKVSDVFTEYFRSLDVNVQVQVVGSGTVSEEIKKLLGLSEAKKDIIFTIIKNDKLDEAFNYLETRFKVSDKHKGIAFSVSLHSLVGLSVYKILSNTERLEPLKEIKNGK